MKHLLDLIDKVKADHKLEWCKPLQKSEPLTKAVLHVKPGTHKLRQLRDLIEEKGGQLPKREVEKLGFNLKSLGVDKLVNPQGILSSDRIKQHIESLPATEFDTSHSQYGEVGDPSNDWNNYPEEAQQDAFEQAHRDAQEAAMNHFNWRDYYKDGDIYNGLHDDVKKDYRDYAAFVSVYNRYPRRDEYKGTYDKLNPEQKEEFDQQQEDENLDDFDDWLNTETGQNETQELKNDAENSHLENLDVEIGRPTDYPDIIEGYQQEPQRTKSEYEHATQEQRHSTDLSKVFQLNLGSKQIADLKNKGLWDTYRKLWELSNKSSHPVGENGIGWVRYTEDKDGVHVDEVQSDFGQGLVNIVKEAKARVQRNPEEANRQLMPGITLGDFINSVGPESVKQITDTIFQGNHPSQLLMDGLMQKFRSEGKQDVPIHIWDQNPKGELANQDVPEEIKGYTRKEFKDLKPEVQQYYTEAAKKTKLKGLNIDKQYLAHYARLTNNQPHVTEKLSPLEITEVNKAYNELPEIEFDNWTKKWQPEYYKKAVADTHALYIPANYKAWIKNHNGKGDEKYYENDKTKTLKDFATHSETGEVFQKPATSRDLPVHMQYTYNKMPKQMGFKGDTYGKLSTQHNPELKDKPTWSDKIRKTNGLMQTMEKLKKTLKAGSAGVGVLAKGASSDEYHDQAKQSEMDDFQLNKSSPESETEQIKLNEQKPEAKKPHKFKAAQWTHPNGHPRCIICGDEERTGGMCSGVKLEKSLSYIKSNDIIDIPEAEVIRASSHRWEK